MRGRARSRRATVAIGAALLLAAVPGRLSAQGPPAAPVNLQAEVDDGRVELTWDEGEGNNRRTAVFYRVYRDGDPIGTSSDEDFDDHDVEPGNEYVYEVTGVDVLGREGDHSAPLTVSVPSDDPPGRPENLVAEAVSESAIELRWDAVTGTDDDDDDDGGAADRYRIYRNGSGQPIDSTTSTTYTDTGLSSFTIYTYQVAAVSEVGVEGEPSDRAAARTLDGSPPTAPANLTAEGVPGPAIALDWEAASDPESGIERYEVYRDGGSQPIASTTATEFTDDGIEGPDERTYEVAAVNGAGMLGPRSGAVSATPPDESPPVAPAGLTAEATSPRSVALAWGAAADPESGVSIYLVYRDGGPAPIDSTTSTEYADSSVEPETSYTYEVSARNGAGIEGSAAGPVSVTTPAATDQTPPSVPGDFAAEATGPSRVELSWTAADDPDTGVASYRVYRDDVLLGTSPGGGFTDLTAEPETIYNYQVSAVNGDGLEGPRTDVVEVTTPGGEDTVPPAPPTGLRVVG